jgi:hypothetical protein
MTNVHTCVVGCQITMSDLTTNVHTCLSDKHYIEHVVCQMTMPDLMMNVQTCITDDTTNPCSMSDHYVWFNDECKNMFYW